MIVAYQNGKGIVLGHYYPRLCRRLLIELRGRFANYLLVSLSRLAAVIRS